MNIRNLKAKLVPDTQSLINMALMSMENKKSLEHTHSSDHYLALIKLVEDWINWNSEVEVLSNTHCLQQQLTIRKVVCLESRPFDVTLYLDTLEMFFSSSQVWENSKFLQEEHVQIICYIEALRYPDVISVRQEVQAKKRKSKFQKASISSGCCVDLIICTQAGCDSNTYLKYYCIEVKLLCMEDLLQPFQGLSTLINPNGRRRGHLERGVFTLKDLIGYAVDQSQCYYDFQGIVDGNLQIPRYGIVITPYKVYRDNLEPLSSSDTIRDISAFNQPVESLNLPMYQYFVLKGKFAELIQLKNHCADTSMIAGFHILTKANLSSIAKIGQQVGKQIAPKEKEEEKDVIDTAGQEVGRGEQNQGDNEEGKENSRGELGINKDNLPNTENAIKHLLREHKVLQENNQPTATTINTKHFMIVKTKTAESWLTMQKSFPTIDLQCFQSELTLRMSLGIKEGYQLIFSHKTVIERDIEDIFKDLVI